MVRKTKNQTEQLIEISDTDLISKEIIKETAQEFSTRVEELVWSDDISYFESVQKCAEKNGYEPERITKLLTEDLFGKLKREAEKAHLIKKENNNLEDI